MEVVLQGANKKMKILLTIVLLSSMTCMAFLGNKKQKLQAFNISGIISKVESEKDYAGQVKVYHSSPKMILKDGVFVSDRKNMQIVSVYGLTKIKAVSFFKAVTSEIAKRDGDKFLPIEFKFFEAENLETKNNVSKRSNENLYFTIIYRD